MVLCYRTFSKLQLVQDGSFTGSIETDHKDSHLLLAELQRNQALANILEEETPINACHGQDSDNMCNICTNDRWYWTT